MFVIIMKKERDMSFSVLKEYISVKNIIVFAIILVALWVLAQVTNVIMLFFASYVIACSFNPIVNKLEKKMKRSLAVALLLFLLVVVLFILFIPVILSYEQVKILFQHLPEHFLRFKDYLLSMNIFGYKITSLVDASSLFQHATEFVSDFVNRSITVTIGVASGLVNFFAFCLITYYFMLDEAHIKASIVKLFTKKDGKNVDEILETISKKIGGYVFAQVVTMAAVGFIFTIALLIMRVDYAVILGVITGVLDIIPVVGPLIAFLISIAVCWQMGIPVLIGITVAFMIAQWAENNLLRPYIFSKFMDLHPLVIFFSLLVTAKFLGVVGVIFAPAIAATVCVLIDELYIKNINKYEV